MFLWSTCLMQSWEKGPARSGFARVRFESTVLTARRTPAISIFVDDHWNDSTYPLRGVAEESKSSGTKADGSELDRRGTPSYWRYFIYRTKTILSLLPHFSFVYLLLTWSGHGRPEVGIRINIRRWRTKLQAVLSAALAVRRVVVVAAADADAGWCWLLLLLPPRQETNERRSSCPLGAQWKRRPETITVTVSWVLDNRPLLRSYVSVCVHVQFSYQVWCYWRNCARSIIARLLARCSTNAFSVIDFRKLKYIGMKRTKARCWWIDFSDEQVRDE